MPPINDRIRLSKIAIARAKEATYNMGATLAVSLECDKDTAIPNPAWTVENNSGRASGKEFPDKVTDAFRAGYPFPMNFAYPQPHEFEALFAYCLGGRDAAVSVGQGVYRKKLYSSNDAERPSTPIGAQLSDSSPIAKLLLYGAKINSLTLEGNRTERFPTLAAEIVTSGKDKSSIFDETLQASSAATSLTLARKVEGSDAAARLYSIHRVLADVDGDGKYDSDVRVTAASGANPGVLTVTPPGQHLAKVAYSDNGVLTDYSDAANDIGSAATVPAGFVTGEDYLYLGFLERVGSFYVDMGATVNDAVAGMTLEYWDGAAWSAVTIVSDGTDDAGDTLKQDGIVTFVVPADWQRYYEGVEGDRGFVYWLRMSADANLDAGTVIDRIYTSLDLGFDKVYRLEGGVYTDESADGSGHGGGTVNMAISTTGQLLLASLRPVNGLRFALGVANATAAVLTIEYWNGSAWAAVANPAGVVAGATPFSAGGDGTWDFPTASKTVAGENTAAFTVPITDETTKYHWIRITSDATLTGTVAAALRATAKYLNYWVVYRGDEALYLPEMATMPEVLTGELPVAIHMAQVFIGGKFDGVNFDRGYGYGCDLNSFSLTFNNNHGDPVPCFQGESDGAYGDELLRGDPECSITVERRLKDWLVQRGIRARQTFSVHFQFIGEPIPDTDPVVRPRVIVHADHCWYEEAAVGQSDNRFTESLTLRVGEGDDHPALVVVVENADSAGFAT